MRLLLGSAAAALMIAAFAPPAAALPLAPGAETMREAAPALTETIQRRRYYRPRVVCGVRYRRFYNGLFWQTAPIRVCWRRY